MCSLIQKTVLIVCSDSDMSSVVDKCQVLDSEVSKADYEAIRKNFYLNMIKIAEDNPETDFYYFFTPYSIYYWDELYRRGLIEKQLLSEEYVIDLMLNVKNIHLFSFFTNHELICDADNYVDMLHYSSKINNDILRWIWGGEYELNRDNWEEYIRNTKDFYLSYDYDRLYTS